ncbi:MAG: CRISPR-associated endoribonuclease Cas6, partial [Spirochaetia bacterium]|nr:CRISPR-associated endoribonuclease Cas6 [Spirochaetota bacterium]MDW8112950.1 CRISPR-associated endoribonuclease Cas6 [Spirochaetia bacterium]
PPVYFYFATSVNLIIDTLSAEVLKIKQVKIGNNQVMVESVDFNIIKPSNEVDVKTVSPITVHIPEENKNRYLSPYDERFFEFLKSNLNRKFMANFGYSSDDVLIIPLSKRWKKVVTFFKNTPVVGWEGRLLLKGEEKMIGLALSTGLGSKNSQGFGMIIEQDNQFRK